MAPERGVLNDPEKFSSRGLGLLPRLFYQKRFDRTARMLAPNQVHSRRRHTSCFPRETRKASLPDQQTSITTTFQGSSYVGIK